MAVHGTDATKPLSCGSCGKRFLNNSALACHAKVLTVNRFTNLICRLNQTPRAGARREKTAYDCPICGTVFDQIVSLKEHIHVHCINGQYGCPHCSKVQTVHRNDLINDPSIA